MPLKRSIKDLLSIDQVVLVRSKLNIQDISLSQQEWQQINVISIELTFPYCLKKSNEKNGIEQFFFSFVPGYDLIEWLMERLNIEESLEAVHIANQLCNYGYFFPVSDSKNLIVKDDSSLYRFQVGLENNSLNSIFYYKGRK